MGIAVAIVLLITAPGGIEKHAQVIKRNEKKPYEQAQRAKAIRALGSIATAASTKLLIGLLEDAFAHQRDNAVSALIALKKKSAEERGPSLQVLLTSLRSTRSAETRRHIATALRVIRDPAAITTLARAILKEKNPATAKAMALALGRIGKHESAVALRKAAETRPVARAAAIRGLGYLVGESEFVRKFGKDRDDAVRAAVVDALIRLRSESVPSDNPGPLQGVALAEALPRLGDAMAARKIAEVLLSHSSWRVRSAGIAGIESRRQNALLDLLVMRIEKETGRLRHDAWMALKRLTGRDVPPTRNSGGRWERCM